MKHEKNKALGKFEIDFLKKKNKIKHEFLDKFPLTTYDFRFTKEEKQKYIRYNKKNVRKDMKKCENEMKMSRRK